MITCRLGLRPRLSSPGPSSGKTSAWTFSTWKGRQTNTSNGGDPLEDALDDLIRAAQHDLDGASRMELQGSQDSGELTERPESVTFILMAPGYCLRDFKVRVVKGELRVEAPDFEVTRALGCPVEPSGAGVDYRNGVLSIRVPKRL